MLTGNIVNTQYVQGLLTPGDTTPITPKLLSTYALNQYSTVLNDAVLLVNSLKVAWGTGVSTLITIFNATGHAMTLKSQADQHGHIGTAPYDSRIDNGQGSAVLHVKTSGSATGSEACVAYNIEGDNLIFVLCWSNPFNHNAGSPVGFAYIQTLAEYNAAFPAGFFANTEAAGNSGQEATQNGLVVRWSMGNDTSPQLQVLVERP